MTGLQDRAVTPLSQSLVRLDTLVSPITGIVRDVHTILVEPAEAPLVKVGATISGVGPGSETNKSSAASGGYASNAGVARAAALGEAAERYAGTFVPVDELVFGDAEALGSRAVDPASFALFAPEQYALPGFPFQPFDAKTPVRWARAFRLPDGARRFVPAQLVYLPWRGTGLDDTPIGYATSSGLACAATIEEALLAALLEVVERDAFMLAWNHRLSLPLLDWSADRDLVRFEQRYIEPTGAHCDVVDLSVFVGVPAAAAYVRGDGVRSAAVAVGAAAAPTANIAIKKAVAEAFAVRSWGTSMLRTEPPRKFASDFSDVVSFADHIRLYAPAELADAAGFLVASAHRRSVDEIKPLAGRTPLEQLRDLARRLARHELEAYAVDATTADLADAGLAVAKVLVPPMCALDVRHDARFLGGSRLRELPHALGLAPAQLRFADVNPYPHPFP